MINCKEIASFCKNNIKKEIEENNLKPTLAVIQVGNDPASNSYIKGKKSDCEEVGIDCLHYHLAEDNETWQVMDLIRELNSTPSVHGIIVQLPLPKHMNKDEILNTVVLNKDVDGFRYGSPYTPCTPKGVMSILDNIGVNVDGKICCVIGRGEVGKPMVDLLTKHNATVIWCNSHTPQDDLEFYIASAEIVISAVGKPGIVKNYCDGKIFIDVGITRGEDGKLHGDVDQCNYSEEALITPVPGGVGLMTRVSLLENVLNASKTLDK